MLTIEVVAIKGKPPTVPMSARFSESGGTIGRDLASTLVLPDPEKRVSRRHALVSFHDGRFHLRNQGSVIAVLHNGAQLDFGSERPIAAGDRLEIGEFSLEVRMGAAGGRTPQQPQSAPTVDRRDADILAGLAPSAGATDPFADLLPPRRPASAPSPAAPAAGAGQIPDDFDPFRDMPQAPAPSGERKTIAAQRDDFSDLIRPRAERVDELFGLRSGDSFPSGHPLAPPGPASGRGPVGIDDLISPQGPPAGAPLPAQRNDASELDAAIRLPGSRTAETPQPPQPSPPISNEPFEARPAGATRPPTVGGMMLSWDHPHEGDGVFEGKRTVVISASREDRARAEQRGAETPASPQATAPASLRAADAGQSQLLAALLEGLGIERLPENRGLDPETLRRVGILLRAALQGTIDLLRARAAIKTEVQAQVTMIVARDNNPLKFSPNVEAALVHLLGPSLRGFMSPGAAVEDAYRDLVAHQFGFTAGTRAALAEVVRRFDPASLEGRLAQKSMLDSLLPANRKAKLWDLFAERFAQISTEAEDDFQRLFGKEFLRAYDEQVAKMTYPDPANKG